MSAWLSKWAPGSGVLAAVLVAVAFFASPKAPGDNATGAQVIPNLAVGSIALGVTVEPLLAWLWIGGLIVGLGSGLSFLRRRYNEETP